MNDNFLVALVLGFAGLGAIVFALLASDVLGRCLTWAMRPAAADEADTPPIRLFEPGTSRRQQAKQTLVDTPAQDPWGWLATGFVLSWEAAHRDADYHRLKLLLERADSALFSAWIESEHNFLNEDRK